MFGLSQIACIHCLYFAEIRNYIFCNFTVVLVISVIALIQEKTNTMKNVEHRKYTSGLHGGCGALAWWFKMFD